MHFVSLHPAWAIFVQHNIADTMKCIISRRTPNQEKEQSKWNRRLQLPIWLASWLDHVCCIFRDRFCRQLFRSLCFCLAISASKFILLFGSLKSFMKTEKKLISRSSTPQVNFGKGFPVLMIQFSRNPAWWNDDWTLTTSVLKGKMVPSYLISSYHHYMLSRIMAFTCMTHFEMNATVAHEMLVTVCINAKCGIKCHSLIYRKSWCDQVHNFYN